MSCARSGAAITSSPRSTPATPTPTPPPSTSTTATASGSRACIPESTSLRRTSPPTSAARSGRADAPRRDRRRGRAARRAQLRLRHVLGDPLGVDPRLRAVGGGAGGGVEERDAAADARRFAALVVPRDRPRRRLVVVLVRRRRAGALFVPQGRRLHRGDGIRVCLHEPGD